MQVSRGILNAFPQTISSALSRSNLREDFGFHELRHTFSTYHAAMPNSRIGRSPTSSTKRKENADLDVPISLARISTVHERSSRPCIAARALPIVGSLRTLALVRSRRDTCPYRLQKNYVGHPRPGKRSGHARTSAEKTMFVIWWIGRSRAFVVWMPRSIAQERKAKLALLRSKRPVRLARLANDNVPSGAPSR